MRERIVLDPSEVAAAGRVEIDLTADGGAIQIGPDGPQWGEATVEAYMSDGEYGSVPVDHTTPNKQHEIPLILLSTATVTLNQARTLIQQWVGRVQQEGGWLMRELGDGSRAFCDVVRASLRLGGDAAQARGFVDANAVLIVEALPDWYGEEVLLGSGTITGSGSIRLANVPGDYPARMRAVIRDTSGNDQRSLLYAVRPEDTSATARMDYAATELTPLGSATNRTTFVEYASLPPAWVATLSTNVAGEGLMTHVGPHRVWVLASASGSGDGTVQTRLEWAAGSGVGPRQNPLRPVTSSPTWVDLGEVQIPRAVVGAQQWEGRFLVNAPAGWTYNVYRVLVLPVERAYGKVNATTAVATGDTVVAWDGFAQTPGVLAGQTAPEGGRWVESGTGAAFQILNGGVNRSASDSTVRLAHLDGVNVADVDLSWTVNLNAPAVIGVTQACGRVRVVDANNYVYAGVSSFRNSGGDWHTFFAKQVGGTGSEDLSWGFGGQMAGVFWGTHTFRLVAAADGTLRMYVDGALVIQTGKITDLATGGPLARGSVGLYDWSSRAESRYYDNILASETPLALDATLHANQSAELATTGYQRASSDGLAYAPLTIYGDLPRLPVSGAERRPVEVYAHLSRALHGQAVDPLVGDGAEVTVFARPCHLFTPESSGS